MTIDVHTYYRNRLALEEAVERARLRQDMAARHALPARPVAVPRRPIVLPLMVVYGVLAGLAYAAWVALCLGSAQPVGLLAALGSLWGLVWGLFFHLHRERIASFLRSLTAEPLPPAPLLPEEEAVDLSWMSQPAPAWTPGPAPLTAVEPMSTFPKPQKTVPNTFLEVPAKPEPMGSMLNQLTESLGETAEPKAKPAKAKVWGTPVEMARSQR